jgi:hypothetical protein
MERTVSAHRNDRPSKKWVERSCCTARGLGDNLALYCKKELPTEHPQWLLMVDNISVKRDQLLVIYGQGRRDIRYRHGTTVDIEESKESV